LPVAESIHPSQTLLGQLGRVTGKAGGDAAELHSDVAARANKDPSASGCRRGPHPASAPVAAQDLPRERCFWQSDRHRAAGGLSPAPQSCGGSCGSGVAVTWCCCARHGDADGTGTLVPVQISMLWSATIVGFI